MAAPDRDGAEVLFGQAYYLRFDEKLWQAMQPYPPLGTLYAASYLRSRGYRVALFDAMLAASEEEWGGALERHTPRFAVLYEDNFNYLSKMCLLRMRQAAFTMIAMARQRGCTVIVAGADASDHAADYLARGADFILLGEGERTLGELMDRLTGRSQAPFESIQGLAFIPGRVDARPGSASTEVLRTLPRPDIRDLDALPFPAWDLVDIPRYRKIWLERHGYYSMNMVTTRGCPFHCNWCAKPIWGQRYNVRSPMDVIAEMKWLQETYHPDHIWFVDDIFGLKPGWLQHFADLAEAEDLRIPFKCLNRVDLLLREGEIDALRRAGCRTVWVGAESGSQKILDAMEKGTRVEQVYAAAQRLHAAGLEVGFFLQFGYPGESREDIEKTLQMVRDCQPDDIGMSVSYPLPGTRFYESVREQLGATRNWFDSSDLAMLYHGPYSTAFYRQLHITLHREFRMRMAWSVLVGRRQGRRPRALLQLLYQAARLPLERRKLGRLEAAAGDAPAQAGLTPPARRLPAEAAGRPTPQMELAPLEPPVRVPNWQVPGRRE